MRITTGPAARRARFVGRKGGRRLTLITRVIALAIIGLATAVALDMMGADRSAPYLTGSIARAAVLAQERLNSMSRAGARDLNPLPDSLARGTFSGPDTIYHWFATVRPVRGEPDMYDVTVTVAGHGAAYKLGSRISEIH